MAEKSTTKPAVRPKRAPRPNYAQIHSKALPLETFPLPAFVPHNPLSLFRILGALLGEYLARDPTSRPKKPYLGHFSSETRSVHVTDPAHVRALWEMGFFGKGSLSRSEPSWLDREKARRIAGAGGTSEEATSKRRAERRMFKLERARAEREAIEEQLRREGKLKGAGLASNDEQADASKNDTGGNGSTEAASANKIGASTKQVAKVIESEHVDGLEEDAPLLNQEHLQLSLHEAFFLSYGLGVLSISSDPSASSMSIPTLFPTFAAHSSFPITPQVDLKPDNPFLISYAVYHHYRSLGWVVRPGAKFAADWLLYNRGPVFSHAEFAVIIIPEYPEEWETKWGQRRVKQKKWWELHCTNRVQSQVRKTLVICYVEVPMDLDINQGKDMDIGAVLKGFRVRDFVVRRWLANRSRD